MKALLFIGSAIIAIVAVIVVDQKFHPNSLWLPVVGIGIYGVLSTAIKNKVA